VVLVLVPCLAAVVGAGCKASELTPSAANVALLYDEPIGCEEVGEVVGIGGGLSGAYSKPKVIRESAENDARNKAAQIGATHLLLYPEEVEQGDGRGPDYQDTAPALAHGSGTGSTVQVRGLAFRCAEAAPETKSAAARRAGSAFVEVEAPVGISLAPLGNLTSVAVFRRAPAPSGGGMEETRMLVIEDTAQIDRVVGSLEQVEQDPLKYIPTHRVELTGELGVQSLLYGFGYLEYAGAQYRLTDGVFEEVLQLRQTAGAPEVENESPANEETSGGEVR
jgi:hypothetical protein